MPDPLLPIAVPVTTACLIAGQSPRSFKRYAIDGGCVVVNGFGRVTLTSLERFLNKPVTPEMYLKAERQRDKARAYQRQYRERR